MGVLVIVVGGAVSFVASSIYTQKYRYPKLFKAFAALQKRPLPAKAKRVGPHDYDIYQVCVAANYRPIQTLMETMLVWKTLSFKGALFLQQALTHFHSAKLTRQHWSGAP